MAREARLEQRDRPLAQLGPARAQARFQTREIEELQAEMSLGRRPGAGSGTQSLDAPGDFVIVGPTLAGGRQPACRAIEQGEIGEHAKAPLAWASLGPGLRPDANVSPALVNLG